VNILRVIKAARISAMLQLQIEPADLFRVFPAFALSDATPQTGPMERDATTDCSWPNCVRSSPICGAGRTIRGRSVTTGEPRASVSRPHTPTAAQMLETTSISLASRIRPNCDGGHRLSFNPSLDMTPRPDGLALIFGMVLAMAVVTNAAKIIR
jgi:hypothetical protein